MLLMQREGARMLCVARSAARCLRHAAACPLKESADAKRRVLFRSDAYMRAISRAYGAPIIVSLHAVAATPQMQAAGQDVARGFIGGGPHCRQAA